MAGEIHSNAGIRTDLMVRPMNDVKVMDFFGSVQQIFILNKTRQSLPNVTLHDQVEQDRLQLPIDVKRADILQKRSQARKV